MNIISLPVLILASISFYAGLYHLLVYSRQRENNNKQLSFGLTCLAVGIYDVCAVGVYNANSVMEASPWQRGELIAMMLFGAALLWFIADYTSQKPKKLLYTFTAYFLISAVVQAVDRSELTWLSLDHPSIKEIVLPNGFEIAYYEMTPGPFTDIQSLLSLPIFIFMLWMAARYYKRGYHRNAVPLLLALIVFWIGIFNDTLVSSGVYNFIYLIEYSFMAIILLMAISLAHRVAAVADSLRESEERYRKLVELSPDAIAVHSEGVVVFINPAGLVLIGAGNSDKVVGKPILDFVHPDYRDMVVSRVRESLEHNIPMPLLEEKFIRLDGATIDVEVMSQPTTYMDKPSTLVIFHDITERKQAEREIKRRADEFAALYETTRSLSALVDLQSLLQKIVSNATKLLNASAGGMYLYDSENEELQVVVATDATVPVNARLDVGAGLAGQVALSREPMILDDYQVWEGRSPTYDGIPFRAVVEVPMIYSGELVGVLVVHEVGESTRKFTEKDARLLSMFATQAASAVHETRQLEKNRRYLDELETVNRLSTALRAAHTLDEMLPILLDETLSVLNTGVGAIWLYDPESDLLWQAAAKGWFNKIGEIPMRVGEDIGGNVFVAGEAHRSREFINDPLVQESIRSQIPAGWGGACLPISIGDEVTGVFFVATQLPREISDQEIQLLSTLTEIGGITIHRMRLYEETKLQAAEIEIAYEATLEGWARALELRDQETEGHSRRVVEMTKKIARALDFSEQELLHIHRGVLLHDIGKMAIPNDILQKPGPLSEEEWVIMRQHPIHAYELLRPISYLRPALDIPYCHHEKWDGSGYPRGLKGNEIPLMARIFSVVDVWDALRTDRPYRFAWPEEKVFNYIKECSGTHFDPQVVKAFFQTRKLDGDIHEKKDTVQS